MLLMLLALAAAPLVPFEVNSDDDFVRALREHYTKHEHMIAMRDGVNAKEPRVLGRLLPTRKMLRQGYIIVQQDVRGRMMAEGTFVDVRPMRAVSRAPIDESTDAYDTIDWLVKNVAGHNSSSLTVRVLDGKLP